MVGFKKESIKQKLISSLSTNFYAYLYKQINPPPPLFFTLFISGHLGLLSSTGFTFAFFLIGLAFSLIHNYNHFYYYSPILNSGIGNLSILNMLIGLVAANQRWKLYLFLFILGDSITSEYKEISPIYLIGCSLFICIEIYRKLVFKVVEDNKIFFIGFFSIFGFFLFQQFLTIFQLESNELYYVLPFLIFIAHFIIKFRIKQLKEMQISEIKDTQLLFHYFCLMEERLKDSFFLNFVLGKHKKQCCRIQCFCQFQFSEQNPFKDKEWSRKIYENLLIIEYEEALETHDWNMSEKQFLQNKYLELLLSQKKIMKVLFMTKKTKAQNPTYYRNVQVYRLQEKVSHFIREVNYFDKNQEEYKHVFQYSSKIIHLNSEIRQIIKEKIFFWMEVGKVNPNLCSLQRRTRKLVQRIEALHEFYSLQIEPSQQKIHNYEGTIHYSIFILGTTNFFQYSQFLIRSIQHKLNKKVVDEYLEAEAFGIEVRVEESNFYSVNGTFKASQISLKIKNISQHLTEFFGKKASQFIGKDVMKLIPKIYHTFHYNRCQQFFNDEFQSDNPYQLIKTPTKLPFFIQDEKVKLFQITMNFSPHIFDGITLLCTLQECIGEKNLSYTNFNGEYYYEQEGIKVLKSQTFSQILNELKKQWQETKIILPRRMRVDTEEYCVKCSFQNLSLKYYCSPVLEIERSEIIPPSKKPGEENFEKYWNYKKELNEGNKNISLENDSISSIASRNESVLTIIYTLSETKSLKIYRYFRYFFIFLIIICFVLTTIMSYCLSLDWVSSTSHQNPVENISDFRKLKITFNSIFSWKQDVLFYQNMSNNTSLNSLVNRLYPQRSFLEESSDNFLDNFFLSRSLICPIRINQSPTSSVFLQLLNEKIDVSYNETSVISLPIQDVLSYYIYGTYLFSERNFEEPILEKDYFDEIFLKLEGGYEEISREILQKIEQKKIQNIILVAFFTLILILLAIPAYKFNSLRVSMNEEIYDLLLSIQINHVAQQIKKFINLEKNIIKKFCPKELQIDLQPRKREYTEFQESDKKMQPIDLFLGLKAYTLNYFESVSEIEEKVVHYELQFLRKKNGELDISGSEVDSKKINYSNWCIPSLTFGFIFFIVYLFSSKIQYFSQVQEYNQMSGQALYEIEKQSLIIALTKIYIDQYSSEFPVLFNNTDLGEWIDDFLEQYSEEYNEEPNEEELIECLENRLMCDFPLTQIILKSFIYNTIRSAYQHKQNILNNIEEQLNKTDEVRYKLFFSQQMCDRSILIEYQELEKSFESVSQVKQKYEKKQLYLFAAGLVYGFVSIIVGLCFIRMIQKRYLKDACLLLFLTPEMVSKNKRIISFVSRLEKNNQ